MKAAAFLHNVSCNRQSRNMVDDCSFDVLSRLYSEQCSILNIVCFPHSNCTEGAVRLADGKSPLDGIRRVEVCVNGFWGALPPPKVNFYSLDRYPSTELEKAERICRQFGLPWECELVSVCVFVYRYIELRGFRKFLTIFQIYSIVYHC